MPVFEPAVELGIVLIGKRNLVTVLKDDHPVTVTFHFVGVYNMLAVGLHELGMVLQQLFVIAKPFVLVELLFIDKENGAVAAVCLNAQNIYGRFWITLPLLVE